MLKNYLPLKNSPSFFRSALTALLVCGSIALSGCLGLAPTEDPSRFYTLTASDITSASESGAGMNVGIREVTLPGYQSRANIAFRKSEHEIAYLPFHEWAEPLNENILRVVGENLLQHPEIQQVYTKTWTYSDPLQIAASIKIERFEWDQSKSVVALEGVFNWNQVVNVDQKIEPQVQPFSVEISVSEDSNIIQNPTPVIEAMNAALSDLSQEMAGHLVKNR